MTPTLVYQRLWRAATKGEQHQLDADTLLVAVELIKAGRALYDACGLDDMDAESTARIDKAMQVWDAATAKEDEG